MNTLEMGFLGENEKGEWLVSLEDSHNLRLTFLAEDLLLVTPRLHRRMHSPERQVLPPPSPDLPDHP